MSMEKYMRIPGEIRTMRGTVIDLTEQTGGCKCRNNRQRLAAWRLAQTIFLDQPIQGSRDNGLQQRPQSQQTSRKKLSELLGNRRICMECVRNALLIGGDVRGESFELSLLNALNPLPQKQCHKK